MPMKSTWFSRKPHHEFARCLREADYGRSTWELYSDFLLLAYSCLVQSVHKLRTGELNTAVEEDYLRTIKRYKNPSKMSEAMAHLVNALEVERYDFLGTVAGELEILNEWHGQFFTPSEVCKLMARMTMSEQKPDPERRLTICEPASGAGAMCLAVAGVLHENGFMPWNYWITAIDVDVKMAMATYIQLTLCGIPANVIWGNTLSLQIHRDEPTIVGVLHPYRPSATERAEAAARAEADLEKQAAAAKAAQQAELEARIRQNRGQLELFTF